MTSPASVEADGRLRLFCGFPVPGDAADVLAAWQSTRFGGISRVRIVPRAHLHFTVAFLGSRPAGEVPAVVSALRAAAAQASPPSFTLRGYREARSVAMLVFDGPGELAEDVQRRLEALGVYRPERRRWLPHVTVLRFRTPPRLTPGLPELGEVRPSDVALYNSVLRSTGAQYEILESFALGG